MAESGGFCYYYPDIQKWKIYRPLADKRKKWFTNVPFDYIEGMNRLINCNKAFIAKSKKDYMVLKKALGLDCIIISHLWEEPKDKFTWNAILIKAKEMEKQQIENAYNVGNPYKTAEQYYNQTYKQD